VNAQHWNIPAISLETPMPMKWKRLRQRKMTRSQVLSTDKEGVWVILFCVFILVNAADFITTKVCLDLTGLEAEVNPVLRIVMASFGIYALVPMKTAACGVVWLFRQKINTRTLLAANIAFSALAVNNALQYSKLM
jgi:hypothetical protein